MTRVVVTGVSGQAGLAIVSELSRHKYTVIGTDLVPPQFSFPGTFVRADLFNLGQCVEVTTGASALIHLAAASTGEMRTESSMFLTNVTITYNVFRAAVLAGIRRIVWASSDAVIDFGSKKCRLQYVPVDEHHPICPQGPYSLSKVICEDLASLVGSMTDTVFLGLRFSRLITAEAQYAEFPNDWRDAESNRSNLWSYLDVRDAATSCRLALESQIGNSELVFITARDTCMNVASRELLARSFPDVTVPDDIGEFGSLVSTAKASRMLGYRSVHSWRHYLEAARPKFTSGTR